MKILYHILFPEGYGDDRFVYEGYRDAFEDLGHVVRPLTERDNFSRVVREFMPDVFMAKQALFYDKFVGNAAEFVDAIYQFQKNGGITILEIGSHMPAFLIDLIKKGKLGDIFFVHDVFPPPPFQEWTGKNFYMLPMAASRRFHFPTQSVETYACDIVYIGANLKMKRDAFRERLLPLFRKYDVRVYGADWDAFDRFVLHPLAKIERMTHHLGSHFARWRIKRQIPLEDENKVYSSAKIALNFHENYAGSRTVNGRTFKIPACGGFEVCDFIPAFLPELRRYFAEDEVVMPKSNKEWFDVVAYYLRHEKEREEIKKKATTKVLTYHTFHNRVEEMLSWL